MIDVYREVKEHFSNVEDVIVNAGRGAQGMKLGKKMFAMFYKGQLVVMLSPARIAEVVASGEALPFDPGTGKPMKDRALIPDPKKESWISFCEESRRYLASR